MQECRGVARALAAQRLERIVIGIAARVPVLPDLLLRLFIGVRAHLVIVDGAECLVKLTLVRHGGQHGIVRRLHGEVLQILRGNGVFFHIVLPIFISDRRSVASAGGEGQDHRRGEQQR